MSFDCGFLKNSLLVECSLPFSPLKKKEEKKHYRVSALWCEFAEIELEPISH